MAYEKILYEEDGGGLSRVTHDPLLRGYLDSEKRTELTAAFGERRTSDASKFGH